MSRKPIAKKRCMRCRQRLPWSYFRPPFSTQMAPTEVCVSCRVAIGEITLPEPEPKPRLMQELRRPGVRPNTPTEKTLVAAARVIASRQWDMTDGLAHQSAQRLYAALFAKGLDVAAGQHAEAARIRCATGDIIIDFIPGDIDKFTTRLLTIAQTAERLPGCWLLITQSTIPASAIDAIERHAGRPIGVYPQTQE